MSHPGRLGEVANDRFGEFQFAEPGFRSMAAAGKPLLPFWVDMSQRRLISSDTICQIKSRFLQINCWRHAPPVPHCLATSLAALIFNFSIQGLLLMTPSVCLSVRASDLSSGAGAIHFTARQHSIRCQAPPSPGVKGGRGASRKPPACDARDLRAPSTLLPYENHQN